MSKGPHAKPVNPQADQLLASIDSLESRVQRSQAELDSTSRLETLGLLTGAIAHEFNNILTPVLSYARVALERPEDRDLCQKALERAATGVERASRIASSVLRLAGPDASSNESCSPAAALQAAIACLPQPLDAVGIELRTRLPDQARLAIPQTDLEHVLLNLLLNSCRAIIKGDAGGGVIEVEVAGIDGPGGACSTWNSTSPPTRVALIVRDDGPGIDDAARSGLFQPFQKSTSSDAPGHGLGLAICRRLIEAAGGTIGADRETARGAVFVIELPAASTHETPAA
ncbi:MAG: sensor histidine kinase [Phycisphaerales bacterium JB041]